MWWRRVHVWGTPGFILAMTHGILSGTDTNVPFVWLMYMVTGGIVLFLLIVRGLTSEIGLQRIRPEHTHPGVDGSSAIPASPARSG